MHEYRRCATSASGGAGLSGLAGDPLSLGQKLVAVLEGGRRTATYKLAVMVALLDIAVESVPDDPDAEVVVNLDNLTYRVMDLYWRQLRPLDGHVLRQSNDGRGVVFRAVAELKDATGSVRRDVQLDVARVQAPEVYAQSVAAVKDNLVRYPLKLLQRVRAEASYKCFLYDDSWMGNSSAKLLAEHDNSFRLLPGVGFTLARLAPLLKPAFQLAWVDDVRRMNKGILDEGPDLAHHLFGAERVGLSKAGGVLAEEFGAECFYCATSLRAQRHVDHILPWSRVGIDGLSNLVLSCQRCNSSKSDLLPDVKYVRRALERGEDKLAALADSINWPNQYERVKSAARGLYATRPDGSPIWLGRDSIETLGRVDFEWF